jgi:hypothetical protein
LAEAAEFVGNDCFGDLGCAAPMHSQHMRKTLSGCLMKSDLFGQGL